MPRKDRDFSKLRAGLDAAAAAPAPPEQSRGRGRPASDTSPMQLRLSAPLKTALVTAAAEASIAAGRTITPQQIIISLLEERYG